jgi:hypothetical protein
MTQRDHCPSRPTIGRGDRNTGGVEWSAPGRRLGGVGDRSLACESGATSGPFPFAEARMEHRSFSVGRSAVQTSATPASPSSPRRSAMRQRRRVAHWLNRSAMEAVRLGARADDLAALRAVADRLRADAHKP